MAIYHCSAKIIGRSSGRSAVGASAYRAGEKLQNEHDGMTHDYTKKSGVVYSEIMLCENAPVEYQDRQTLWNEVEKIEKGSRAQLSREIEVALPEELNLQEQKNLIQDYVKENFVSQGMCADIAIHDKKDGNPHAHIMLTMRSIDEQGKWESKSKKVYHLDKESNKIYDKKKKQYKCHKENTTNWNEKENIEKWRSSWADKLNGELEKKNILERVDHRSFERQGTEKIPTQHLGATAFQLEKRGIKSDRGNYNREIEKQNVHLLQLEQGLKKLQEEIKSLQLEAEHLPPTETPKSIANILFDTQNKFLELVEDIQDIQNYRVSIEQEKRSIKAGDKNLSKDYQSLANLHKQIDNQMGELSQLNTQKSIFKSYKNEIQSVQNEINHLKERYNYARNHFIDTWKIKPNQENINEKLKNSKTRLAELESMELPTANMLEQEKNNIIWEYKIEYVLAQIREDLPQIKSELAKLEIQANPKEQKESLKTKMDKQELYITSKDIEEIISMLERENPEKAQELFDYIEREKPYQEQEQSQDFGMEL